MALSLARPAVDHEDYTHPEKIYKNLVYAPDRTVSSSSSSNREIWKARKELKTAFFNRPDDLNEELCWSCGWSAYDEILASYGSRIRIFYTSGNVGIWKIGSRWLIRDQPNDASLGNDFITLEFLRNQAGLNIPLVEEMRRLSAPTDKTISPAQRSNYKDQLGEAIKQWRQFTSPIATTVDGEILNDSMIANCLGTCTPTYKKMGRTNDEWFQNIETDLRFGLSRIHKTKDPVIIEEKFQELKKNFPKSEPYVLTHGDLNFTNIMVKDDKIVAIIDWERSGYLPWWAERWLSLIHGNFRTDLLFDPLWADIGVEMDAATFQKEIIDKVAPVTLAWNECAYYVEHPNSQTRWLRPGFCKCKPIAGHFKWTKIGNQVEHNLKDHWVG